VPFRNLILRPQKNLIPHPSPSARRKEPEEESFRTLSFLKRGWRLATG